MMRLANTLAIFALFIFSTTAIIPVPQPTPLPHYNLPSTDTRTLPKRDPDGLPICGYAWIDPKNETEIPRRISRANDCYVLGSAIDALDLSKGNVTYTAFGLGANITNVPQWEKNITVTDCGCAFYESWGDCMKEGQNGHYKEDGSEKKRVMEAKGKVDVKAFEGFAEGSLKWYNCTNSTGS